MKSKLPEGWKEVKLQDITKKIGSGATPRGGSKVYIDRGISFIRSQNVLDFNFLKKGLVYIDEEAAESLSNVEIYEKDVLINITGDSVARTCVIPPDILPARVNQHVSIIRTNENLANYKYVNYKLFDLKRQLLSFADSGGTRKALTKSMLQDLKIYLPSLKEQNIIADTLSALDNKIKVNKKINNNLEEQAQALFKHWFVNFEFPNEDGEPYQSSGGEMVESELGMIPPVFEVGSLGKSELGNLMTSGVDSYEGEKIYLATADVSGRDIVNHETMVTVDNKPSRANMQPKENTVWFAKMKNSRKLILVDQDDRILQDNYIISTGFAGIKATDLSIYYLWTYLQSDEFDEIKNLYTTGTTMQAINNKNIRRIQIAIPTDEVLEKFNYIVQPMYKKIIENRNENIILSELRDTLLPKLMSGELRIPLN